MRFFCRNSGKRYFPHSPCFCRKAAGCVFSHWPCVLQLPRPSRHSHGDGVFRHSYPTVNGVYILPFQFLCIPKPSCFFPGQLPQLWSSRCVRRRFLQPSQRRMSCWAVRNPPYGASASPDGIHIFPSAAGGRRHLFQNHVSPAVFSPQDPGGGILLCPSAFSDGCVPRRCFFYRQFYQLPGAWFLSPGG